MNKILLFMGIMGIFWITHFMVLVSIQSRLEAKDNIIFSFILTSIISLFLGLILWGLMM